MDPMGDVAPVNWPKINGFQKDFTGGVLITPTF